MKTIKLIIAAVLVMVGMSVSAQWTTNSKGIHYNDGWIGVGTTNPMGSFHISLDNPSVIIRNFTGTTGAGFILTDSPNSSIWQFRNSGGAFRIINSTASINPIIIRNEATAATALYFSATGLGVGTTSPETTLDVNGDISADNISAEGKITTQEVEVTLDGWSDYVFDDDYKLQSLSEVEKFIKENKHLPGIPSEKEIIEEGLSLGEINKQLMAKIEELTLYVIDLQKQIKLIRAKE